MFDNIKFAKQIVDEIQRKNEECKEDVRGYANGEDFEKWLKRQLGINYDNKVRQK